MLGETIIDEDMTENEKFSKVAGMGLLPVETVFAKENYKESEIKEILKKLSNIGPEKVILTGVSFENNKLGIMGYDKEKDEFFTYFKDKINVKYHGTGDVFASALVGAIANNKEIEKACKIAVDFVWETINDIYYKKKKNILNKKKV